MLYLCDALNMLFRLSQCLNYDACTQCIGESIVKTITISDDVYNELVRIKGKKSFSELFRELLRERKSYVF